MAEEPKKRIKHIEFYIIGAIALIVIASVAFVYGCKNMNNYEEGYYTMELKNPEIPQAASEVTMVYYLEGSSSEITKKKESIESLLTPRITLTYASLDESEIYDNYISIGYINDHPNEEITVGDYLYSVLKDAYNKTITSSNYSIFAEPLYEYWRQAYNLRPDERISKDPAFNVDEANYLTTICGYTNSREHIDFEFLDDSAHKLRLKVSEDYLAFARSESLEKNLLSLNILKNAYIIEDLAFYFTNINYTKGYFVSYDGYISSLEKNVVNNYSPSYYIYTPNDYSRPLASILNSTPSSFISFKRFNLNGSIYDYSYSFTKDDVKYYRSRYIDINTGLANNNIVNSSIMDNDISLVQRALINCEITLCNTSTDVKDYLVNKGYSSMKVAFELNNSDKNLYITESMQEYISLSQELDYNLIKI